MRFGRPEKPVPEDFSEIVRRWERQELNIKDVLLLCGMSNATFYRRLRELRLGNIPK